MVGCPKRAWIAIKSSTTASFEAPVSPLRRVVLCASRGTRMATAIWTWLVGQFGKTTRKEKRRTSRPMPLVELLEARELLAVSATPDYVLLTKAGSATPF